MLLEKLKPIVKGYIKALISKSDIPTQTGGTNEAEYCYSTWLRHLIIANEHLKGVPQSVLELGPGDTLGNGICALLCGSKSYIGLDIYKYWEPETNLKIFDELVRLFSTRSPLPAENKYPSLTPHLSNYDFPRDILSEEMLHASLAPARLSAIRNELKSLSPLNSFVKFYSPWERQSVSDESIDFIFSQSVLQYTDLELLYGSIAAWLKPGGLTAHVIDFSSLGITKTWNGHWSFSDREWKHYSFRKSMLLNRAYLSVHKKHLESRRLEILMIDKYTKENILKSGQLGESFKAMSEEDLTTHAAYMLSRKFRD